MLLFEAGDVEPLPGAYHAVERHGEPLLDPLARRLPRNLIQGRGLRIREFGSRFRALFKVQKLKRFFERGAYNLVYPPKNRVDCHCAVVGNIHPVLLEQVLDFRVVLPLLGKERLQIKARDSRPRMYGSRLMMYGLLLGIQGFGFRISGFGLLVFGC